MRRAAIVAPVRTPVGRFGGALRDVPVEDLAGRVITEVVARSGVDPERIDDVVFAQSYSNSETPCIGRWAALHAGLPEQIPGMQLDRRCGGGLQAVASAAMMVQSGSADIVVAGGAESMSRVEYYSTDLRWGVRANRSTMYDRLTRGRQRSQPVWRYGEISGMIETAENLARKYRISRESADEFAARSHQRAQAAWESGRFHDEVVSVEVSHNGSDSVQLTRDEGVRPGCSPESLSKLESLLPNGTVTAGNAAQQSDAAAACLVVAEDVLGIQNLTPMAWFRGWAAVGCNPAEMGMGPVPAATRALARAGLTIDDFDLIEINEAFACQVQSVLAESGWHDGERVNVNGSGISLGHPIAATGVRIMTTMLHELQRRRGSLALETMCIGGGQGMAAIFETP